MSTRTVFSRREFLKISALLTSTAALASPRLPNPPLRFLLVGNGRYGRILREEIQSLGGMCAGIVDEHALEAERDAAFPCFGTFQEALPKTRADVVAIATPDQSHCDLAVQALESDHAVLLAAPICMRMGELEQLQNLAAKMRMATQTILPGRLRPELAELSTLLAAGGIGQTKSVTCRVAAPLEQAWQQHGAKTNGLLAHFGEGLIDFVSGSLPPGNMLSEVNSFGDRLSYVGSGSSPALQTARFKFGETNVELFAQRLPPGCVSRAEVVFTGSAGTVYLDWFGAWAATPNDGGRSVVGNSPNGCFERRLARLAWADLAEAIAHGREPKASFATVAPAARACLAANAAFQSGRTLRGDAGQISACASEIFRVMA